MLYVRQLAWLNAVPDDTAGMGTSPHPDAERQSRRTRIEANGAEVEMPEADGLHLVGYLWEIGPIVSTGMGGAPISHLDIQAWQTNIGIELSAWEARLLRGLSLAYLAESTDATKSNAPPPWQPIPTADKAVDVARRIRDVLRV